VKRLIIADAHLGQGDHDQEDMALMLECARTMKVEEVVYLGDVCQYLIGYTKFFSQTVTALIACWRRLRHAGMRIVLIEGNRDFFLDGPGLVGEIDWFGRRYEFTAGNRRYRLEHGDLVNRRDLQYRFWSVLSKSRVARWWAELLPQRLALTIVRRMEQKLAKTNRKYRYRKPIAQLKKTARQAWEVGIDVVLWGHFHSLWQLDEASALAMVVPAWLEYRVAVLVDEEGSWQLVDQRLTPVPPPHNNASTL